MNRSVLALALVLAAAAPAPAPSLRTLHVEALSMRSDKARVQIGETFHLSIHAHVRESIAALDELVLPDVGTMQILGDERHVTSSPAGTDIVETLTLEPTAAGAFTFAGAYVDAINARDGKPSRFRANPVRIVVDPAGPIRLNGYPDAFRLIGAVALAGFAILALGTVLVTFARRRPAAAPAVPLTVPVQAPAPRTARDAVADALRAYRAAPQMPELMRVRGALFNAAGVPAGATLRDALAATPDQRLRAALLAAERAAFGPAHARDVSSAELLDATEAWLR